MSGITYTYHRNFNIVCWKDKLKHKKKKKKISKIVLILIVLGLISFIIILLDQTVRPAYGSYKIVCLSGIDDVTNVSDVAGYQSAGVIGIRQNDTSFYEINFTKGKNATKIDDFLKTLEGREYITLKHELCHYNQHLQNREYGCDQGFRAFLNELECYTTVNLPNFWRNF